MPEDASVDDLRKALAKPGAEVRSVPVWGVTGSREAMQRTRLGQIFSQGATPGMTVESASSYLTS